MLSLNAFHHILVSSAETISAFITGFDTVNLHRPTAGDAPRAVPVALGDTAQPHTPRMVPRAAGPIPGLGFRVQGSGFRV